MKYIAKVYEDGDFAGYLTKEPDTEPTYNRGEAMRFESREQAKKHLTQYDKDVFCFDKLVMVEANLNDASLSTQMEEAIRNWVRQHYGESEIREPAWNIELLAKDMAKRFGKK